MKFFLILVLISFSCLSYGQNFKFNSSFENRNASSFEIKFPLYNIHLGLGLVNGANIGSSIRIDEKYGFEISYGRNLIFNSGGKINYYFFGLNGYGSAVSGLTAGILFGYQNNENESTGVISPNAGYFYIGKEGFTFQARGGLKFYTYKNYSSGSSGLEFITFDISFGKSF